MELIAIGDEAAFTTLFENYRNKIYTVAFRICKSIVVSEEIVQDVFLKIWLKRAELNQIENFSAYLFVITRNKVYKVLGKTAHDYRPGLITDEECFTPPKDIAIEKEYELVLKNAVSQLPHQQKKVYYLKKTRV